MKSLILMRHAKADDQFIGSDLSRPLTEEGMQEQREMALFFKQHSYKIDGILYSPYKRAEDSAKIVYENYPKAMLFKEPALGNVFDSFTILQHIEEQPFDHMLIVGHAPTLSAFGQSLLERPVNLQFEKSGIAILNFQKHFEFGKGNLIKALSPKEIA